MTTYPFDGELADRYTSGLLSIKTNFFQTHAPTAILEEAWSESEEMQNIEEIIQLISPMPPITIVKYRTIGTDLNGDKTASDYKYVSCIPDEETEERVKWAKLINRFDGGIAGRKIEIGNNLSNDGLITSSVQRVVYEKYGNL